MNRVRTVLALLFVAALAGCYREQRQFEAPANAASVPDTARGGSLTPGGSTPLQSGFQPAAHAADESRNAYDVSQGKRLFRWYNCNGCHSQGGGGMGPPLMDARWRYGHTPDDIYRTILEGRPNGMPAFGGRVPREQIWQLVAYVRSMSGQLRKDVAPSRADGLLGAAPENERDREIPVPAGSSASTPSP